MDLPKTSTPRRSVVECHGQRVRLTGGEGKTRQESRLIAATHTPIAPSMASKLIS
jgi:hypothetical protein